MIKACVICGEDFEVRTAGKVCSLACKKITKRNYKLRYREKNPEKIAQAERLYREKNSEKIAQAERRYREKNSKKVAEARRLYCQKNREKKTAEAARLYPQDGRAGA